MYATTAAQTFTWRSTDNSGWVAFDVEGYAVDGYLDESEYGLTTRSYTSERTGNAYSCGEGDWEPLSWWDVTARDRAGNATTKSVGGAVFQLYQEDGSNVPNDYYEGDQVTVAYTGTWAAATCACWSAGATRKTTTRGSAVTFTVPVSTEEQAAHVGLVMHRGPSRGAARIIVDGVTVATVDTGATSELPKSIVWQTALKPGTHTVKVVNLATTGRTRIDIDALLVN